ncbi:xylulokinase [Halorubrum sp. CBA1125]|uniref:xylulokinase n=1 Tax=Halorubrum sp. CBA1125 TaxID=2668072 RepID=UPI0012E78FB6|nr:xylulokinase [Halorubrum sp. CBA1125]MUW14903.1 xylulokinase [Halorubrum sp. CBA1125]
MSDKRILAHDLGTTGNKATVYDEDGNLLSSDFAEYETFYLRDNWAEQDATQWWSAVRQSTQSLLDDLDGSAEDIDVVSFSGQMMGCLPVDEGGDPLRRAIIWADQRAVDQVATLEERVGRDTVYEVTGHPAKANYTAAKVLWIRDHEPSVFDDTYKFLQAKDFVIQRLTGEFVTDYSDASGTNLYDLDARDWSDEILTGIELSREKLPPLHASTDVVGEVSPDAAERTGLEAGTPVVAGGGDGSCATVGAGVVRSGEAYTYLGTSAWVATASEEPIDDPDRRTFTWAHLDESKYVPMGTMQSAGGSFQWAIETIGGDLERAADVAGVDKHDLANLKIADSDPGADRLLFLPYLLGERSPHWNPDARGVFVGLSKQHSQAELLRAVVEGVCFNLRIIWEALQEQGIASDELRAIGGGAKSDEWHQILADVLDTPVVLSDHPQEATSLGAAVAGGIGVGIFSGFDCVDELVSPERRREPTGNDREHYDELFEIFKESYDRLTPIFDRLADTTP